jgi:hypothetical protein
MICEFLARRREEGAEPILVFGPSVVSIEPKNAQLLLNVMHWLTEKLAAPPGE